jgi:hypothetical protein
MVNTDDVPEPDCIEERWTKQKKAYKKPSLVEWGSIRDLTGGGLGGYEDAPEFSSGTHPY